MKKVIALVLSLVLALGCLSAFAFGSPDFDGPATFDEPEAASALEGHSVNDGSIDSSINRLRMEWTASRGFPTDNAMFVNLDGNVCIKLTNNEYITADYQLAGTSYATVDLKVVNPGAFCGILLDATDAGFYGSSDEINTDVLAPTHDRYILNTGYGFTIIDKNTVRVFVNASNSGSVDYADFALPFDASADFHSYALYRDEDNQRTYLVIDNKTFAYVDIDEANTSGIYKADGTATEANDTNPYWGQGQVIVAVSGACEVYLDNIDVAEYEEVPEAYVEPAAPANRDFDGSKDGMAYDQIWVNGKGVANGNDEVIAKKALIDGSKGDVQNVTMWGWFGSDEAKTAKFGYSIDGGEPVFDEEFFFETEEAVKNAKANGERYDITVDVTGLKDGKDHVIEGFALLENGSIVKMNRSDKDRTAILTYRAPSETTTPEEPSGVQFHGASFDTLWFDDKSDPATEVNFGAGDGAASDKLDAHNGRVIDIAADGAISTITLRGWIGFEQDLTDVGYQIGDNAPVFVGSLVAAEDDIKQDGNGGAKASRFQVVIPVADLEGSNNIVLVAKVGDDLVKLDNTLATVGQATCPNTGFTFVGAQAEEPTTPPDEPQPPMADASLVVFVLAAAAIALVVLKKKAF